MACLICNTTPLNKLKEIDQLIRQGEKSVGEIAAQYEVSSVDDLASHARVCIVAEQIDGFTQLEHTTRKLRDLGKILQDDIEAGGYKNFDPESGIDGRSSVTNYIAVLREMRESVLAMKRLRSVDDTAKGLTDIVISPMIATVVQIYVEEARRLREALYNATPESTHARIKTVIDESLTRVGNKLKTEGTQNIKEKVEAVLSAKTPL
jgi:hypothetical protein